MQSIIKIYQTTNKIADKPHTGHPRKIEPLQKLAGLLQNDYNLKVDPETVRIILRRAKCNGRVPLKKPNINKVNKSQTSALCKASH